MNFNESLDILWQLVDESYPPEDPSYDETRADLFKVINIIQDSYILSTWPDSQELMEEEGAIFVGGSEDITGSSAYIIPIDKYFDKNK